MEVYLSRYMKYLLTGIILCCLSLMAQSQTTLKLLIRPVGEQTSLAGATLTWQEQHKSYIADSSGTVTMNNIPDGPQTFIISHIGYKDETVHYTFPLTTAGIIIIEMETREEENEETAVLVTATRTSRTIANTPTRIEVISGEELEEKGNMKPGDIRMMLNESTGIQTQQTSATSYSSSIRIQGLDGRYTQLLRDGYPLYSGFSGGLSLMQIAPLDLRQVEVIKGSSSTLYGGGAIAGLVNLVSKIPTAQRELRFMANATSAKGLDLSGFYSQRFSKVGVTVFGSRNSGRAYDPAHIGLTALPEFERYTISPRFFLYGKNTTVDMGFSYITEDRTGGSIDYIKEGTPGYFEQHETDRFTTQLGVNHRLGEHSAMNFKNSYTRFHRTITLPSYQFIGLQQATFSELTYSQQRRQVQWIVGANVLTDGFSEEKQLNHLDRSYYYTTYGMFLQNAWSPLKKVTLETGLRGDYVTRYGFELLPRLSVLFHVSPKITMRIGSGFGYKTPNIFTEDAERIQFAGVQPINPDSTLNERSVGGNWDINYHTRLGGIGFSINQLFFYTRLNSPLILTQVGSGTELSFMNAEGHLDTKGMETNLKLTYGDFKLFVGYTYTDANTQYTSVKSWLPLTARHRLNNVLVYEKEDKFKLGLEAYYVSKQQLNDGGAGKPYWIAGFMAEKLWEHISLFVNLENFTDTRQTKWDTIFTGTINNPVFRDIYAPVEGFVLNGGFKLKL